MISRIRESLIISSLALLSIFSAASNSKAQGGEKVNRPKRDGLGTVTLPAKPKEGTDAKPSYPTGDLMLPAIRDLIVSPTMTGMTLTFAARSGPVPVVEIAAISPFTDSRNHSSFHPTLYQFNPVPMKNKSTPKETAYAGGSYQLSINLNQDTKYYYIVTLPAQGSFSEYQLTGSFKTTNKVIVISLDFIFWMTAMRMVQENSSLLYGLKVAYTRETRDNWAMKRTLSPGIAGT